MSQQLCTPEVIMNNILFVKQKVQQFFIDIFDPELIENNKYIEYKIETEYLPVICTNPEIIPMLSQHDLEWNLIDVDDSKKHLS